MKRLNTIRKAQPINRKSLIIQILIMVLVGSTLGVLSKVLDSTPSNVLPQFLEILDLSNFFSRMGIWLFLALCISIYSKNPFESALKVFIFFLSMVTSYYLYTSLVLGFYPINYMMIWGLLTLISPILGFICFYARGEKIISMVISMFIVTMMSRQTFAFGILYFDVMYYLELILWALTLVVLYRSPKQILIVTGCGLLIFMLTSNLYIINGII